VSVRCASYPDLTSCLSSNHAGARHACMGRLETVRVDPQGFEDAARPGTRGRRVLRDPKLSYTRRTTHTMSAMMMIVPRMPPIYIRISVNDSESQLTHIQVSLSGR
jgi:hypothetical protein